MTTGYGERKPDRSTDLPIRGEACALPIPDKNLFPKSNETATHFDFPIDWEKKLNEHEHWLRTVIAARVGEYAAVDEVFQEVSLAAIRQKAPITDPSKAAPWLYQLAVRRSLLYRRTMGRKRKLIERYTERVPVVEHDAAQLEPLDWLIAKERQMLVRQALRLLPKREQELLLLKYIHDWSYRDMAEKLGLTVSAVQAKLHRARALLREKLSQLDITN